MVLSIRLALSFDRIPVSHILRILTIPFPAYSSGSIHLRFTYSFPLSPFIYLRFPFFGLATLYKYFAMYFTFPQFKYRLRLLLLFSPPLLLTRCKQSWQFHGGTWCLRVLQASDQQVYTKCTQCSFEDLPDLHSLVHCGTSLDIWYFFRNTRPLST